MLYEADAKSNEERVRVEVNQQADILSATAATRKANLWLAMNVGHLLQAQRASLVLNMESQTFVWQFQVALMRPLSEEIVGQVGAMQVDALSGKIMNPQSLLDFLLSHAIQPAKS